MSKDPNVSIKGFVITDIILNTLFLTFSYQLFTKRLHDIGKSGYEYLLYVIVCIVYRVKHALCNYDPQTLSDTSDIAYLFDIPFNVISLWFFITLFRDSQPGKNRYGESEKYPNKSAEPSQEKPLTEKFFVIITGVITVVLCACNIHFNFSLNPYIHIAIALIATALIIFAAYKIGYSTVKATLITLLSIILTVLLDIICDYWHLYPPLLYALIVAGLFLFVSHKLGYSAFKVACLIFLGFSIPVLSTFLIAFNYYENTILINRLFNYIAIIKSIIIIFIIAFYCLRGIKKKSDYSERPLYTGILLLTYSSLYIFISGYICATTNLYVQVERPPYTPKFYTYTASLNSYFYGLILAILSFYILILFFKLFSIKLLSLRISLAILASTFIHIVSSVLATSIFYYCSLYYDQLKLNQTYEVFITVLICKVVYTLTYSSFTFTPKTLSAISTEEISAKKARIIHLILVTLAVIGWLYILILAPV